VLAVIAPRPFNALKPRRPARRPALFLLAVVVALTGPVSRSAAGSPGTAAPASPFELMRQLESAWRARDAAGYLALWSGAPEELLREEELFARERFSAEESELRLQRPGSLPVDAAQAVFNADLFTVREPRGKLEQFQLLVEQRGAEWRIVERRDLNQIDGFVHVSLDPAGYRAAGLTLRFEDFELRFEHGTLFTSPAEIGPTAIAFVGEGTVRVSPKPEAEREQLRQFCGTPELAQRVTAALVRIHPADLSHVLDPVRLEPDPEAERRWPTAQRLFREQGSRAYLVDAALPRSPWWLFPGLGDSAVSFETAKRGTLTFTVSSSEPEGISLFDRGRRRQICLYPRHGGSTRYSEDDARGYDILSHDLRVRFEPGRQYLEGEDTLLIRLDQPVSTLRLRLDDSLRVESVRSAGGSHLFLRIRNQNSVMVSLGHLAGAVGEIALSVRYSGTLDPGAIDHEMLQQEPTRDLREDDIPIENVLVYANRTPWYPQGATEDYAEARVRLEVPAGFAAITGGRRVALRAEESRTVAEYLQEQPGRYITAVVGRLVEAGARAAAGIDIQAFTVPRLRPDAEATLRQAAEILDFYVAEFGPAPYSALNLVLTEGYTPGGHSPPGMVVLQRRPPLLRGNLRDDPASFADVPGFFLAHELAHQWWGHGVAGQNYRERWLSEALAHYAAALFVRRARGEDAFQGVLRQMGRWALRYTDQGPIHLGYRLGHLKGDPQIFRAVVYDKGAYVLHMLRGVVGEEAFRAALRSLQASRRYEKIGTDDLREALEAAADRPLGAYFDAWVLGTRVPALQVSGHAAGSPAAPEARVEVAVKDLPGPVPLEIALVLAKGRVVRRVTLPPEGGSWSFEVPSPLLRVEVNGDRALLAVVTRR
jgi:hypothetical protein